jgi:putative oxidoreductase
VERRSSVEDRRKYRVSPVEGVSAHRSWIEEFLPDVGVAALRLAIAGLMATHALREFFGILLGDTAWMGTPGMFTDRWIAATLLAVGALLLIVGWFTRVTAILLAVIVTLSWFAPYQMTGHWQVASRELIAAYVSVLLVLAVIGPGWFSIDAWRAGRFRARRSTMKVAISPWIKSQYRRSRLTR